MVVKIADTEREKNAKRLQGALAAQGNVGALTGLAPLQFAPLQEVAAYYQVTYTERETILALVC